MRSSATATACWGRAARGSGRRGGAGGAEEEEEEESKQQMLAEFKQAVSSSKRLHTEWTVNIGEHILDIQSRPRVQGRRRQRRGLGLLTLSVCWQLRPGGAVQALRCGW